MQSVKPCTLLLGVILVCQTLDMATCSTLRLAGADRRSTDIARSDDRLCRRCICHVGTCPSYPADTFRDCLSNEHLCCCCLPNSYPCVNMAELGAFQSNSDDLAELEQGIEEIGMLE